ncbi:MAG: DUF4040 domain-containing protein [Planctomycetota bacterium]
MNPIIVCILILLVATAIMIARLRDLWAAIMATGIYSFLGAAWMLLLDAPDVAVTEAAVGSGIATVLMLTTISLTGCRTLTGSKNPGGTASQSAASQTAASQTAASPTTSMGDVISGRSAMALVVVVVTGAALVYGTLDMPKFGDPKAPIQTYPDPSFVDRSQGDMHGLPNVVTAVLASYRGYDTLGETTVILTAGLSVLLILRRDKDAHHEGPSGDQPAVDLDAADSKAADPFDPDPTGTELAG